MNISTLFRSTALATALGASAVTAYAEDNVPNTPHHLYCSDEQAQIRAEISGGGHTGYNTITTDDGRTVIYTEASENPITEFNFQDYHEVGKSSDFVLDSKIAPSGSRCGQTQTPFVS